MYCVHYFVRRNTKTLLISHGIREVKSEILNFFNFPVTVFQGSSDILLQVFDQISDNTNLIVSPSLAKTSETRHRLRVAILDTTRQPDTNTTRN